MYLTVVKHMPSEEREKGKKKKTVLSLSSVMASVAPILPTFFHSP